MPCWERYCLRLLGCRLREGDDWLGPHWGSAMVQAPLPGTLALSGGLSFSTCKLQRPCCPAHEPRAPAILVPSLHLRVPTPHISQPLPQIDLTQSTSSTLPFENGHQVRTLALSPDGRLLVSIDVEGRALVINRRRRALLHHFSFKDRVRSAAFSPDGAFLAVAVGRLVQVWRAPELRKSVAPLALHRTYGQAHADVTVLAWSPCSTWLAAGAEDLVVRPLSLNPIQGYRVPSLMGHRAPTVAVQFSSAAQREAAGLLGLPTPHLWTLAQDGALYTWTYEGGGAEEDHAGDGGGAEGPHQSHEFYGGHWRLASKYYFNQVRAGMVVIHGGG